MSLIFVWVCSVHSSSIAGDLLISWRLCPSLKHELHLGHAGRLYCIFVWEGQEGSSQLTRLLPFLGFCLGCLKSVQPMVQACDEIFQSDPGEIAAMGNGGHAKGFCRACSCAVCNPRLCSEILSVMAPIIFCFLYSALPQHNIFICYLWRFTTVCLHAYQPVHYEHLAVRLFLGTSEDFSVFSRCQSKI